MLELDSNDSEVTRWVVGGGKRSVLMEKDFKWRALIRDTHNTELHRTAEP